MNTLAFIQNIGGGSLVVIVLVVILLFGAKRIPELARGLGRGIREFKDATKEIQDDLEEGLKDDNKKANK
ncbi:twin-arginine translocase TatA/TatE family subunit [Cyclobacterium sp. 1_MG-2023]|jgi:sec-independent protein translocase protein TatA|uniref:Sec-independent protein translocase protein TatA n=1 Tax=Cyclobacterium marinum (strain ATCC 25205 / DSM 745 / LMG 13164 / NCIMB 1802) TaxID=880070 RepID=G0IWN8_CYCMS|nr:MULTISPECIES: twin-arginine translocase TatA/TatE family subunit [Cyclobacterium]AEL24230.1 Sec-independent protein translocase protein tatA/E-like protein [Cyclobacterium marinum DSM 745]MBI0398932.1 twin-arginine translocase TatA/TatE family subunit [Cyclobacterium marinum]MBR9774661.1 twin-arginine translocase TatA/TatE family subunit [Cytophagales bacterium]MDO6436463.1 twin-arginine translocase TatA/TatE family subunit [Cyclobacterium sp. 1_MG-2023]|tara:strand:+ start:61439 stop:61648 length:210 start_codon:yes stop_codon:yes gene_type:complete